MKALLTFLIDRPKIILLSLFFILILGVFNIITLKRTGYPNVEFGMISIVTAYPGASAQDVEQKVTNKIEKELTALSDVKRMISSSIENLSQITLYLEDNIDYDKAEADAQKIVDRVTDLPDDILDSPQVIKIDNEVIPVLDIVVTSPENNYSHLVDASDTIEDYLLQLKEVSSVAKTGYLDREIHVIVDPEKMAQYDLTFQDVNTAIHTQNKRAPGGDLKTVREKKIIIRSDYQSLEQIQNLVIRSGFYGNQVTVANIAQVQYGFEDPSRLVSYNGKRCVQLSILKKRGEDILNTTKHVSRAIETLSMQLQDVDIYIAANYAVEVESLLSLVKKNAVLGFVLVLIFLMLLLEYRVAFWTALGIPVSICIAFLIVPSVGVSFNFISLLGIILVLGMVVDDAIVVSENIYKKLEAGKSGKVAAIEGTQEVMWPVVATILTTIMAFAPLLFMTGVMGSFMLQMPIIIGAVLAASLIESLFFLPVHIAHSKVKRKQSIQKKLFKYLENYYHKAVTKALKHKTKVILGFIGVFLISAIVLVTQVKFSLFYSPDALYGVVEFELPQGTSLEETNRKSKELEAIINTMPDSEIDGILTTTGTLLPDLAVHGNRMSHSAVGNVMIFLSPFTQRERNATDIMKEIDKKIKQLSGFKKRRAYSLKDGPPTGKAVTITVVSDKDKQREDAKQYILNKLSNEPGVMNMETSEGRGKPRLEMYLDHQKAAQLSLSIPEVITAISTTYKGSIVSDVLWEKKELNIRVLTPETAQVSTQTLTQIYVRNKSGKHISLAEVITIKEKPDILNITHYNKQRSVTIYADVDEQQSSSFKANRSLRKKAAPMKELFPLSTIVFGGEERDAQESMQGLGIAMAVALLGIYAILVVLFNSFSQPLIVMSAIPFTFPGIVFAFYTHNIVLGFSAMIGLIGLTGIVVNNSLIMLTFINQQVQEKGFSIKAVATASAKRFRPVVLTTISTSVGLIPSAYGFGGDNSFLIPMIMAVVWGLVFASIVTLFLTPALYMLHYQIKGKKL